MLEINSIHLAYQKEILNQIQLSIPSNQIHGIVGASGSGKSSLLKIIAGLLNPTFGTIVLNGEQVKTPAEQLIPGNPHIQLVNQDFGLDIYHTVVENVVQKMMYLPNSIRTEFSQKLLDLVELTAFSNQKAIQLSGGEQQRLAIARALAAEPDVLLLDEPFAHLDVHLKQKIGTYLKELCSKRKMICLLVSHDGQDVLEWCDQIHFLNDSKIVRSAAPTVFYFHPESEYEARYFGEINSLNRKKSTLLFRPSEYELVDEKEINLFTDVESVQFVAAQFSGAFWRNYICTAQGEHLVLFANKALTDIRNFVIKKQHS